MPPIKPKDVANRKEASIPEPVFDAFNELIAKHWNGRDSRFKQDEVIELAVMKLRAASVKIRGTDVIKDTLFEQGWLDVEDAYRKSGWRVEYDQPAYCENYSATYTFTKNTRGS